MTRDEVVDRIERSWRDLDDLVGGLGGVELQAPVADGWTVQDHLTHLAVWEDSLLALLEGRDRATAMGVPGLGENGTDAINAAVYEQHRNDAPEEALSRFRSTHRRLLDKLRELGDRDLSLPYSHFQPDADDADHQQAVIGWIEGNTFEHYEEHLAYIRDSLNARAG
jgi:uncharacterized protein (TIGR03083 family)